MTHALLNQPKREVTMTQNLSTQNLPVKSLAQRKEAIKNLPRITAEEGARMDAETPPCEPYINNAFRECASIPVDELLEAKHKSLKNGN